MKTILLLFIAVLPILIIGLYIYKKDKEKESKKVLTKLFLFGIISCIPAAILETIILLLFQTTPDKLDLLTLLFYSFIGVALIEETCKWSMVYEVAYNHKEFNHIYDAVVYSVFVSLGFATIENILYVLQNGLITGLIRAIASVPGHACFGIIMGNYLAISKITKINNKRKLSRKNLILSIIIPTIVHTVFNFCLFTEQFIFIIIFLILIVIIYIYGIKKVNKIANVKDNFI